MPAPHSAATVASTAPDRQEAGPGPVLLPILRPGWWQAICEASQWSGGEHRPQPASIRNPFAAAERRPTPNRQSPYGTATARTFKDREYGAVSRIEIRWRHRNCREDRHLVAAAEAGVTLRLQYLL